MTTCTLDEQMVLETLRQVFDPEVNCNIVDLGLIYGVEIEGDKVRVAMTLTTPGCPMHESIAAGVREALLRTDRIEDVEVEIVWDPPWSVDRVTEAGRTQLGIY